MSKTRCTCVPASGRYCKFCLDRHEREVKEFLDQQQEAKAPCDVIDFYSYKYNNVIVYIYKHDDKVA